MAASAAPQTLVEDHQPMMGTRVSLHVAVEPAQRERAGTAIAACFGWFREAAARLTRFDEASELSRLNARAGEWAAVSDVLYSCARAAHRAAVASDGLFDFTLLSRLERLGYDRDFAAIAHRDLGPETPDTEDGARPGAWRDMRFDPRGRRLWLPAGARIDLGGSAKGWMADGALDRFFAPFEHVLLNVGGDMRVRGGPEPGVGWAVGLEDPREEVGAPPVAVIRPGDGGLAMSGATRRWWLRGGQVRHHLIDPRSGECAHVWHATTPAKDADGLIAAVTALAPTAARAEVAAKVALLRGYPAALDMLASDDTTTLAGTRREALIVILGSRRVVTSANLNSSLAAQGRGAQLWIM